jgi:hypothetical protein
MRWNILPSELSPRFYDLSNHFLVQEQYIYSKTDYGMYDRGNRIRQALYTFDIEDS